ncbi:MAG TPA: dephospho-CoA kinase [Pseudolabrys sp.]|nr:dephospho-CoA kinase [Pseudolabrys sp.]
MFILGLTGSIGMGKSTTAKFFAEEGVPVHDADAVVHRLYEGEAVAPIEAAFPGSTANGKVDRAKLSRQVVGNDDAIKQLEQIVHPLVRKSEERFLAEARRNGAEVVVLDIPLLYETDGHERCDAVVVVSAPADVQRGRALERPDMTEEKFNKLLTKQLPDEEKQRRADFVVDSSRGFGAARAQVREILERVAKMQGRSG